MHRFLFIFLAVSILLALPASGRAASEQALKLRASNGLSELTPPEAFLAGNFVADEIEPRYIFGKVQDFVKSRSCPAAWLIEAGEKMRLQARGQQPGPFEYTLYLEEDCPGKVVYYVFVDRSQAPEAQWLEWRRQFHGKSKTEPQYGAVKAALEEATKNGFPVNGELRFIETGGELQVEKPEAVLTGQAKFQPIYDLKEGKAVAR